MDVYERLSDFVDSLAKYPPRDYPDGQLTAIFNALLKATQEAHPDDPVAGEIKPVYPDPQSGRSAIDAGSLIVLAEQLRSAAKSSDGGLLLA
jgi:hypothetical protein